MTAPLVRSAGQVTLTEHDDLDGLDWTVQSVDGAKIKALLGGEATCKNPTDDGKFGMTKSLIREAAGIPVPVISDGANTHDIRLLQETIEHCLDHWPREHEEIDEHVCLDKIYQSPVIDGLRTSVFKYTTRIRSRGEEQEDMKR